MDSKTAIMGKIHKMSWLKQDPNNPVKGGQTSDVRIRKEEDQDFFSGVGKKEKKKRDRKQKTVLTIADLNELGNENVENARSCRDEPKNALTEQENVKEITVIVSESSENGFSVPSVWGTGSNAAETLFPNVQSVIIDRAEEEEMLSLALAESIATAQLEALKPSPPVNTGNRWEALYGDDPESGWDNPHRNLPEDELTQTVVTPPAWETPRDRRNDKTKPGILRNAKENIISIASAPEKNQFEFKKLSDVTIEEKPPRTTKSVAFNPAVAIETFDKNLEYNGNVKHPGIDNDSSESDIKTNSDLISRRNLPSTSNFIDKFGRVGGYSERRLFMGKGARMKEERYLKQKMSEGAGNSRIKSLDSIIEAVTQIRRNNSETNPKNKTRNRSQNVAVNEQPCIERTPITTKSDENEKCEPIRDNKNEEHNPTEKDRNDTTESIQSNEDERITLTPMASSEHHETQTAPINELQPATEKEESSIEKSNSTAPTSLEKTTSDQRSSSIACVEDLIHFSSSDESSEEMTNPMKSRYPSDVDVTRSAVHVEIASGNDADTEDNTANESDDSKHADSAIQWIFYNNDEEAKNNASSGEKLTMGANNCQDEILIVLSEDENANAREDVASMQCFDNTKSLEIKTIDSLAESIFETKDSPPRTNFDPVSLLLQLTDQDDRISQTPLANLAYLEQPCVGILNSVEEITVCQNLHLSNVPCPNPDCVVQKLLLQESNFEDSDIQDAPEKYFYNEHKVPMNNNANSNSNFNSSHVMLTASNEIEIRQMNQIRTTQYFSAQRSSCYGGMIPQYPAILIGNKENPTPNIFVNGTPPIKAFSNPGYASVETDKKQSTNMDLSNPLPDAKTDSKQQIDRGLKTKLPLDQNANHDPGLLTNAGKLRAKKQQNNRRRANRKLMEATDAANHAKPSMSRVHPRKSIESPHREHSRVMPSHKMPPGEQERSYDHKYDAELRNAAEMPAECRVTSDVTNQDQYSCYEEPRYEQSGNSYYSPEEQSSMRRGQYQNNEHHPPNVSVANQQQNNFSLNVRPSTKASVNHLPPNPMNYLSHNSYPPPIYQQVPFYHMPYPSDMTRYYCMPPPGISPLGLPPTCLTPPPVPPPGMSPAGSPGIPLTAASVPPYPPPNCNLWPNLYGQHQFVSDILNYPQIQNTNSYACFQTSESGIEVPDPVIVPRGRGRPLHKHS